jgi:hypothetical protein
MVAVETALLGWLSYWLFLVYANNPSVADQLVGNLQRFPQLSFTTVDISVLAIIAILSIIIAFKFHRGLRPGIRLERALQMLENLMKRNLVLEAHLAELKVEKPQTSPPPFLAQTSKPESKSGSWEKAFRTPLEAGPPLTSSTMVSEDVPFENRTGLPPPRIEAKTQSTNPKPPIIMDRTFERTITVSTPKANEKTLEAPSTSSNWEDSPRFTGESKRILTPSPLPRRMPPVSESGGLKQPYIPAPAPKSTPPSVIVGAMNPPSIPIRPFMRPPMVPQASPRNTASMSRFPQFQGKPGIQPGIKTEPSGTIEKPTIEPSSSQSEKTSQPNIDSLEKSEEKSEPNFEDKETQKPVQKKKFSYEED